MWLPSVLAILTGQWPSSQGPGDWGLWVSFGALVSFPWVVGVSGVLAWRWFVRGARGLGVGLSCLPYANVGLFTLGLHWATTASSG
ncbi:MAG: hypothetical protein EA001_11095 [Oscillatoriales cyanobacterium]|nr:MAG: hypothetical protein EA001_11095 [Oscillatoriales cyanobacterium]